MSDKINDLLGKAQVIIKKIKEDEADRKKEGNSLNFMKATGIQCNEIRHSAFLAVLLDPKGDHGQGCAFLDSFIKFFDLDMPRPNELGTKNAEVITEAQGNNCDRLDILIKLKDGPWFAIENKVWAGEGIDQIKRYQDYLVKQNRPGSTILFLSPTGAEPTTADSNSNIRCCSISYKNLSDWLRTLLVDDSAVKVPRCSAVSMLIKQYAEICSQIGGDVVEVNSKDIENLIRDNLENALHIEQETRIVREEMYNNFWVVDVLSSLNKCLGDKKWIAIKGTPWDDSKIKNPCRILTIVPKGYKTIRPAYCIAIEIKPSVGTTPLIGVIQDGLLGHHGENDQEIRKNLEEKLKKELRDGRSSVKWPWYSFVNSKFESFMVNNINTIISIDKNKEEHVKLIVEELKVFFDKTKDVI